MSKRTFYNALVVGLIVILGFSWAVMAKGKADSIIFSHAGHQEDAGECAICHGAISGDSGFSKIFPVKADCAACHDVEASCSTCHTNPDKIKKPVAKTENQRRVNFVHTEHKDALADCSVCHPDPDKKFNRKSGHEACSKCHSEQIENLLCSLCHRELSYSGLSELAGFTHKDNFLAEHAVFAKRSTQTCTQCHSQAYCNGCHSRNQSIKPSLQFPEKVKASFIHRGDWITAHRIEAKVEDGRCLKCHSISECSKCHNRVGVSPAADDPSFKHEAGWITIHGKKAREEITSCASCHQKNGPGRCTSCHAASAGINPHPDGFGGKLKGLTKSDRMCAQCHDH